MTLGNVLRGLWGRSYEKVKCFEWHKRFKEGHENVDDNEQSGRLRSHRTDENVEKVRVI
jgi:hypothetical protein